MSTKKLVVGTGVAVLLVAVLLASVALAQGPSTWQPADWDYGMMQGYRGWDMPTAPGQRFGPRAGMNGSLMAGPGACANGTTGYGVMHGHGGWGRRFMDPGQACPFWSETTPTGDPLTLSQAQDIAQQYLLDYGDEDLAIDEVMQFSENFYVLVEERDTGKGAFELLINPYTGRVTPEHGPNMMWNTKYGHMAGRGMMGGWYRPSTGAMTVTETQAISAAQRWLDAYMPGVTADEHADEFYGYYTLHTLVDGEISGMLSVNGYTGQVWYHDWHGEYVDMTGDHDD